MGRGDQGRRSKDPVTGPTEGGEVRRPLAGASIRGLTVGHNPDGKPSIKDRKTRKKWYHVRGVRRRKGTGRKGKKEAFLRKSTPPSHSGGIQKQKKGGMKKKNLGGGIIQDCRKRRDRDLMAEKKGRRGFRGE